MAETKQNTLVFKISRKRNKENLIKSTIFKSIQDVQGRVEFFSTKYRMSYLKRATKFVALESA